MSQKRRDFIKILSAGSAVPLLAASELSLVQSQTSPEPNAGKETKGFSHEKIATEVLVAGGGMSGVCAALAAGRNGAKVILLQDRSRLGGNSSSEIRMHVLGANNPLKTRLWRETGIIEELKLTDAAMNPQRSFEMWDLLLYDKVVSEKNITLLLDTALVDAETENNAITRVRAISPWLEVYYEIQAKVFIDCTGDGTLAHLAGAKCLRGREGQDVYAESLAPEQTDLQTMGNSILFFAKKYPLPLPFKAPSWARPLTDADFIHRQIHAWEYGYWWIEWGGELDTIKDNRRIRHELLRIVMGVWDYIKNSGQFPQAENWALDWVGMIPGKRESRRIVGDHVMIQRELETAEPYFDRVAYGGWPMDDHPPDGFDSQNLQPCRQIYFDRPYSIPLRSLYSVNITNLFMAGRNISASHVAFSSTRVMATCATMGQAVGTTAAFCLQHHCEAKEIVNHEAWLKALQQQLLKDDQAMLEVKNEDPNDLAKTARVTASAEMADARAIAVIDGWNREIGDGRIHQWRAPMREGTPWIQLQWKNAQRLHEIQLTFDSGLHRRLFLTGEDSVYYDQIRTAQPEMVKSYVLEALVKGRFIAMAGKDDNMVRLVRHQIEPIQTKAIRVRILQTHGDDLARVFEIRCYG